MVLVEKSCSWQNLWSCMKVDGKEGGEKPVIFRDNFSFLETRNKEHDHALVVSAFSVQFMVDYPDFVFGTCGNCEVHFSLRTRAYAPIVD